MPDITNGANGHAAHTNGKASYAEKHNIADHFIGGNRVDKAPASLVKDFVLENDGHTVITNVSFPSPFPLRTASPSSNASLSGSLEKSLGTSFSPCPFLRSPACVGERVGTGISFFWSRYHLPTHSPLL